MGPALFFLLVLCVVVVLGFMVYGVFLGLGTLASVVRRFWADINGTDGGPVLAMANGAGAPDRVDWASADGQAGQVRSARGCWSEFKCPPSVRDNCPAYKRPDLPCWLAQMESNGDLRLKPDCLACKLFNIPALMTGV